MSLSGNIMLNSLQIWSISFHLAQWHDPWKKMGSSQSVRVFLSCRVSPSVTTVHELVTSVEGGSRNGEDEITSLHGNGSWSFLVLLATKWSLPRCPTPMSHEGTWWFGSVVDSYDKDHYENGVKDQQFNKHLQVCIIGSSMASKERLWQAKTSWLLLEFIFPSLIDGPCQVGFTDCGSADVWAQGCPIFSKRTHLLS